MAREVGTEGKLGGQAEVKGVSGTWRDLTDSVNVMAANLTEQVRQIAAGDDGGRQRRPDPAGDGRRERRGRSSSSARSTRWSTRLSSFADEVTRVAREVGTEGELGGQAQVDDVSGTWRDLTESVNVMASNLTDQVRQIAQVTTAVASGDLDPEGHGRGQGRGRRRWPRRSTTMTDTLRDCSPSR